MNRSDIINSIYVERKRQDDQWGGKEHDKTHKKMDWLKIISSQNSKAMLSTNEEAKNYLITVAAVCFAALENEESWE